MLTQKPCYPLKPSLLFFIKKLSNQLFVNYSIPTNATFESIKGSIFHHLKFRKCLNKVFSTFLMIIYRF